MKDEGDLNEVSLEPLVAVALSLLVLGLFAVLTFRVARRLILGGWHRVKTVAQLS